MLHAQLSLAKTDGEQEKLLAEFRHILPRLGAASVELSPSREGGMGLATHVRDKESGREYYLKFEDPDLHLQVARIMTKHGGKLPCCARLNLSAQEGASLRAALNASTSRLETFGLEDIKSRSERIGEHLENVATDSGYALVLMRKLPGQTLSRLRDNAHASGSLNREQLRTLVREIAGYAPLDAILGIQDGCFSFDGGSAEINPGSFIVDIASGEGKLSVSRVDIKPDTCEFAQDMGEKHFPIRSPDGQYCYGILWSKPRKHFADALVADLLDRLAPLTDAPQTDQAALREELTAVARQAIRDRTEILLAAYPSLSQEVLQPFLCD
jgi:hypothetical protein